MKKILFLFGFLLIWICGVSQIAISPTDSTFIDNYTELVCSEFNSDGSINSSETYIVGTASYQLRSNVSINGKAGTVIYNIQTNNIIGYFIYTTKWKHLSDGENSWLFCIANYYGFTNSGYSKFIGQVQLNMDSSATLIMFGDNSFLIYSNLK